MTTESHKSPKVTIVTACYNRAATIRETIESVLAQDYDNVEYIIIDGVSTDGTQKIVEEYASRLAHFVSEPDHGMYEALNKGLRMATGDIIGWVHSDDVLYDTHTLSAIVDAFRSSQALVVYADGLFVRSDRPNAVVRNWIGGTYRPWKVRHGWLPLHPTCYIRRDYLTQVGLYDESFKIAADTEWLLRVLLHPDLHIHYLRRYVIRMRMGGLSTDLSQRKLMWSEDLRAFRMHGLSPRWTKLQKMAWKIPQFISAQFSSFGKRV
jgi:hypothetical protein